MSEDQLEQEVLVWLTEAGYRKQIPDLFLTNELLVISDGSEARFGSLSASGERFMQWRTTTDGRTIDPLGKFSELEALVRGLLAPPFLLDYAQHLRDALPNATSVAFTGTPVAAEGRDTRAVFGDYIHVYDMQQAQEDGATVAIYFESRLKSRWAALEKVVGVQPRVAAVAADLVAHFAERSRAQAGKAMVVAMSRDICVHLYDAIVRLRPHLYSGQVKKRLEKRFMDPDDPLRMVIVRDMWLTGFDALCVHTLYVDKLISASSTRPSSPRCATCRRGASR